MHQRLTLKIILYISIAGILFSGYLSYSELFSGVCAIGGCSYVLGVEACVYGFIIYLIIFTLTILGLRNNN